MGLKQDLINAKTKALEESGVDIGDKTIDDSLGSVIEREAEFTKEAIVNFLTSCQFRITQLNAPVVLEDLKIPPQEANINSNVQVASNIPVNTSGGPGSTTATGFLENRKNGVVTNDINLGKDGGETGILESTGYVFIGGDPESQRAFDVSDNEGVKRHTTVQLFREDIEDLL